MKTYGNDTDVEVYRRVLKYPPVLPSRRTGPMKIEHNLRGGGKITIESPESVTGEDMEKVFAILWLEQHKKHISKNISDDTVRIEVYMRDISILTNSNDYLNIIQSIVRVGKLSITFLKDKKRGLLTRIVHEAEWNNTSGVVSVLLNRNFYDLCSEKGLTLNLNIYTSLPPVAKNLYSFLISNQGSEFLEDTLTERAAIQASNKKDARKMLRRALDGLTSAGVITLWNINRGKVTIVRKRN